MEIAIRTEDQIGAGLDRQIRGLLGECFAHHKKVLCEKNYIGSFVPSFRVLATDWETGVGHVNVVDRVIQIGDEKVRIAGVANVAVSEYYRGRGLGGELTKWAMREAAKCGGFDVGMLFTREHLRRVYEPAGWMDIAGRQWFYELEGKRALLGPERVKMYYPLEMNELPGGDIDLGGAKW